MTREEQKEIAAKMRRDGLSYAKIARFLGTPYRTVHNWLNPEHARQWNREYCRKRRANDPEYRKYHCERHRKRRMNLKHRCGDALTKTRNRSGAPCTAPVEQLMEAFDGHCAICGRPESDFKRRLCMDHDHTTGEFRGWLCHDCNIAVGRLRDNPWAAFCYLFPSHAEVLFQSSIPSIKQLEQLQ